MPRVGIIVAGEDDMLVTKIKRVLVKLIDRVVSILIFSLRDWLVERLLLLRYRIAEKPTAQSDRYSRRRDRYTNTRRRT